MQKIRIKILTQHNNKSKNKVATMVDNLNNKRQPPSPLPPTPPRIPTSPPRTRSTPAKPSWNKKRKQKPALSSTSKPSTQLTAT